MNTIEKEITNAVLKTLKKPNLEHHLHQPDLRGNENKYLDECIKTNYVSSVGKFVDKFENKLKKLTNSKKVIATINGTAALHLALLVLGVQPNDEVIIPGLSFVATANAVKYVNAIPHFVDISKKTLGMDPVSLAKRLDEISEYRNGIFYNKNTNRKLSAIIPVHTFGHPCEIDKITKIAKKYKLKVLEDSAESIGSYYKKKHTGTFGDLGILSFNGNKTITTGGGGAIIINKQKYIMLIKHLSTTAKISHKWEYIHDKVGYNYRMPNLNAAVGLAQLEQIKNLIRNKRELYNRYNESFKLFQNIKVFKEQKNCKSNYWLQSIILNNKIKNKRDEILKCLHKNKIYARPPWQVLSKLKPFRKFPRSSLKNCTLIQKTFINIPSSSNI